MGNVCFFCLSPIGKCLGWYHFNRTVAAILDPWHLPCMPGGHCDKRLAACGCSDILVCRGDTTWNDRYDREKGPVHVVSDKRILGRTRIEYPLRRTRLRRTCGLP